MSTEPDGPKPLRCPFCSEYYIAGHALCEHLNAAHPGWATRSIHELAPYIIARAPRAPR